jgi:hypothetical protein
MRFPSLVPSASVRRLSSGDEPEGPAVVQHLAPPLVPAPQVVPRQIDPVGLRLIALQLENDGLRAQLSEQRAG